MIGKVIVILSTTALVTGQGLTRKEEIPVQPIKPIAKPSKIQPNIETNKVQDAVELAKIEAAAIQAETLTSRRCNKIKTLTQGNHDESNKVGAKISQMFLEMGELEYQSKYYEITDFTHVPVHVFCKEQALLDNECFLRGTNGDGKAFQNLWAVWDTNKDGKVTSVEGKAAWNSMRLDGDKNPKNLEVLAYLKRNQDILCRPMRDEIEKDLDLKEQAAYIPLINHLTAKRFKSYDQGNNTVVSPTGESLITVNEAEWEKKVGPVFDDLCKAIQKIDRAGWLLKNEKKSSNGVFGLIDTTGDGEISKEEYDSFFNEIYDWEENDIRQMKVWVDSNLAAVCYNSYQLLKAELDTSEKEAVLETYSLKEAISFLDADANDICDVDDAKELLEETLDLDGDKKVTSSQLWEQIEQTFKNLAIEDALSYPNPKQWIKSIETDMTQQEGTANKIAELFPDENSTIGVEGVQKIYRELDLDNSTDVSKKEIYTLFIDNKGIATAQFMREILISIQKLNDQTLSPVQFKSGEFEYYFSNRDQVLNYTDSQAYCKRWGGKLWSVDSKKEFKDLQSWRGNMSPRTIWNGENPELTSSVADIPEKNNLECLQFFIKEKEFKWAADCAMTSEFVCKKFFEADVTEHDTITSKGTKHGEETAGNLWWVYLVILVGIILMLAVVIALVTKKKSGEGVVPKRLATQTPIGSPRGTKETVPAATIPDADFEQHGFAEIHLDNDGTKVSVPASQVNDFTSVNETKDDSKVY